MVTLLRSYAKQISINAMKKIGATLLGLAKYIYLYFYQLNWILRGHYGFIMTASWGKIYTFLGGVQRSKTSTNTTGSVQTVSY